MCGIIGAVGVNDVMPKLLKGLKNMEYRGYDSAGVAVTDTRGVTCVKSVGRVCKLVEKVQATDLSGNCGIGHTRWATHGKPTEENAHPHSSPGGMFYVVHNGIIENSEEIKRTLLKDNIFYSETDTEVFAHLLEKYYSGDVIFAMANACAVLKGNYAFGVICSDYPQTLFAASSGSPLVVAQCESGSYIASDRGAVEEACDRIYRLGNGELCVVTSGEEHFFDAAGTEIKKAYDISDNKHTEYSKGSFGHFMLKEIYEQPQAVKNTLDTLVAGKGIVLPDVSLRREFFTEELEKVVIVACGSAYHAGLVGKGIIERLCKVPCSVEIASEFRYSEPLINEKTLAVFVSQSGETADTLASLRLSSRYGARILSIVNVKGSIIAEESENVIYTVAGREVAVATTKAYSAQLVAFYALSLYIASLRKTVSREKFDLLMNALEELPGKIEETLQGTVSTAKETARKLCNHTDVFFIGRLSDYATASEGSLKMKEISYINSQAYAAGELKHGTISLVENGTPVIAVVGEHRVASKTISNIKEVVSRGAEVLCVSGDDKILAASGARAIVKVPCSEDVFMPSLLVLPLQLMSYFTGLTKGCDIDKPRNLAKSVTVE